MATILYKEEVYRIIGCAMEVHKILGPGFLEGVYQDALIIELARTGIPFEKERKFPVWYKEILLGRKYISDLVCFGKIIVELKATDHLIGEYESQLLNYLKVTRLRLGLLINFGSYGKLEWKRLIM